MNALAVVSIYVVTNRAPYLKCDPSVSVYVAVVWIPDHPTGPDLREGLCQTMLLVTSSLATGAASCRSCVDINIDAAVAVGQLIRLLLIYRYRRQASSHINHVSLAESAPGSDPCGRELARDGGGSVNSSVTDIPLSQASQLPQWPCSAHKISARPRSLWERACSRRRRVSHWIYN